MSGQPNQPPFNQYGAPPPQPSGQQQRPPYTGQQTQPPYPGQRPPMPYGQQPPQQQAPPHPQGQYGPPYGQQPPMQRPPAQQMPPQSRPPQQVGPPPMQQQSTMPAQQRAPSPPDVESFESGANYQPQQQTPLSPQGTQGGRRKLYPDQIKTAYQTSSPQGSFTPQQGSAYQQPFSQAAPQAGYVQPGVMQPGFSPHYQQPSPPNQPGYAPPGPQQQQSGYAPPGMQPVQPGYMNQVANQFGQMNLQQQQLLSVPLIGQPTDIRLFDEPANIVPVAAASPDVVICPASLQRSTMNAVPQNYGLLNKSKVPFGLVINPFKNLEENEVIPVIGSTGRRDYNQPVYSAPSIIRCRRCRAYINPFVEYVDNTHWRCNICFLVSEVPTFFDFDIQTQQYVDRRQRPEVKYACVEYVAPNEYMVRPPQPPVYVFVVDVSYAAIATGALNAFSETLLSCLDQIPNEEQRTRIGFIMVDQSLHFFNLGEGREEPQELIVSDLDDVFLPLPDDLLVNLVSSRDIIEAFLKKLPSIYQQQTQSNNNALGAALQAAFKLMSNIGGKIVAIQAAIPNMGPGTLKPREEMKMFGTPQENSLHQPQNSFYKGFAVDCSRTQTCVDMFLFGTQYLDINTLTGATRFTGGSTYYYPGFNGSRVEDVYRFSSEFGSFISQEIGLEAVLRVRASKGVRAESFHGNFFVRSSDLLAVPNVNPFSSYAFQLTLEENITSQHCAFQSALLYTTHHGERRIRVITTSLPVTSDLGELFRNVDQFALSNLLFKMGVERALSAKLEDARDAVLNKLVEIFGVFKTNFLSNGPNPNLMICDNLKLFPVLCLGMIKHASLRAGSQTPADIRTYAMNLVRALPVELTNIFLYPNMYELHTMEPKTGLPSGDGSNKGSIIMPRKTQATSERLARHGLFLLDTGASLMLWVGTQVPPQIIKEVFDRPSFEALVSGKMELPVLDTNFNTKIRNIIGKLREMPVRRFLYPPLFVVKEEGGDPQLKMLFLLHLVEDRHDIGASYPQLLNDMRERVNKQ